MAQQNFLELKEAEKAHPVAINIDEIRLISRHCLIRFRNTGASIWSYKFLEKRKTDYVTKGDES